MMFFDPMNATTATWQIFGKVIEQQLRTSSVIGHAVLKSFGMPSVSAPAHEPRVKTQTKKPLKTAPRAKETKAKTVVSTPKVAAEPAVEKPVTVPAKAPVADIKPTFKRAAPTRSSKAPVAKPAAASPSVKPIAPVAAKTSTAKPQASKQQAPKVQAAKPRRTRAPSTPPIMPKKSH